MRKNLIVLALGLFLLPAAVLAQTAPTGHPSSSSEPSGVSIPTLYVNELVVSSDIFKASDIVRGSFYVESGNEFALSDVNYSVILSRNNLFIEEINYPAEFFVYPGDKLRKSFTYQLPENLATGDYTLSVFLLNPKGTTYGFSVPVSFKIQGAGNFVDLNNLVVLHNQDRYQAEAGFAFKSNETPVIEFRAANYSDDSVAATPNIKIYRRGLNQELLQEYNEKNLNFAANEARVLQYILPIFDEPESYLADLIFLNGEGKPISNHALFRWIVSGLSAEVLSIAAAPSSTASNVYDVTVRHAGPADSFVNGGAGELLIKVIDQGKVVGQATQVIDLKNTGEKTFSITTEGRLVAPEVQAEIIKNGKTLDIYKVKPAEPKKDLGFIVLVVVIALLVIGVAVLLIKKFIMKNKILAVILLFAGALLLFGASEAQASVVVTNNDYGFGLTWQAPFHNQVFQAGGNITFSGIIWQESCGNVLSSPDKDKIKFYINNISVSGEVSLTQIPCGAGKFCLQYNYRTQIPQYLGTGDYRAVIHFAGFHPWICREFPGDPVCQRPEEQKGYYYLDAYEHIKVVNLGTEEPANLSASCLVPGTTAAISWSAVPGATFYAL